MFRFSCYTSEMKNRMQVEFGQMRAKCLIFSYRATERVIIPSLPDSYLQGGTCTQQLRELIPSKRRTELKFIFNRILWRILSSQTLSNVC